MASPLWGLYDDVAPPSTSQSNGANSNKSTVVEEWSSNSKLLKLMAPQLRKKTAVQTPTTNTKPKQNATQNPSQLKTNAQHSSFGNLSNISLGVVLSSEDDLYDPARPNDYEKRKKKKLAELEKEKRERLEREKHNHNQNFSYGYNDSSEDNNESDSRKRSRSPSPEGLHPSLLALGGYQQQEQNDEPAKLDLHISGEEAYLRRAKLSNAVPPPNFSNSNSSLDGEEIDGRPMDDNIDGEDLAELDDDSKQVWTAPPASVPPATKKGKSNSEGTPVAGGFAARMMVKMGWKGQGLGKDEQGIKAPLQHKKTNYNSGVIVESSPAPSISTIASKQQQQHQQALKRAENSLIPDKKPVGVAIPKSTSKVLLLRNMVGPGEVDPDLESEVASECSKYGQVSKCLIFECLKGSLPDEQAVRIFVQFAREESAIKAYVALNHRFFGGRVVSAAFFDEDRFLTHDLAPKPYSSFSFLFFLLLTSYLCIEACSCSCH